MSIKYSCEESDLELKKVHKSDLGFDIKSKIDSEIKPGEFKTIPTGIRLELPKGIDAEVRPRSGLAKNFGVTVLNSPGTIDNGYRGEIKVILINFGKEIFKIRRLDRIAQIVFRRSNETILTRVDELVEMETDRKEKGFGSSGISNSDEDSSPKF